MVGENGVPLTPEWQCEPRACPIPCATCERPAVDIPPNVILGSE